MAIKLQLTGLLAAGALVASLGCAQQTPTATAPLAASQPAAPSVGAGSQYQVQQAEEQDAQDPAPQQADPPADPSAQDPAAADPQDPPKTDRATRKGKWRHKMGRRGKGRVIVVNKSVIIVVKGGDKR